MFELIYTLRDAFTEIFDVIREYLPKVMHVCLWLITGIIILPCVFIANHFYPMWVKWGEDF